nr:MAG TPA_asm: hypothetical protein [Caudoviricetes sp.]
MDHNGFTFPKHNLVWNTWNNFFSGTDFPCSGETKTVFWYTSLEQATALCKVGYFITSVPLFQK